MTARLAAVSRPVAERLAAVLPGAQGVLGPDLARWLGIGATLCDAGGAGAALAWLRIDPAWVRRVGFERLTVWTTHATALGHVSPALAAAYCEATGPLLATTSPDALGVIATAVLDYRGGGGWHGERVAQGFLAALPHATLVFEAPELARWAALATALRGGCDESVFFRALPAAIGGWPIAERAAWLDGIAAMAARHVPTAVALYRELPLSLTLESPGRGTLLGALARAAAGALPGDLAAIVPVADALVHDVPAGQRARALAILDQVAMAFPAGAPALLRILPRLFEDVPASQLDPWVAHGLALADEHADAARAYFGLASRTSVAVLRSSPVSVALEEAQGVLRKVLQMLSGLPATPRSSGRFSLRPPLEASATVATVALPATVDLLASYEDNRRLYGVLGAWLAARRLYGTYADSTLRQALAADDRPAFLDELFLVADGYRIAHRLAAEYRGLGADLVWASRRLLAHWASLVEPPTSVLFDALLALALDPDGAVRRVPPWLATSAVVVLPALRPLAAPSATAGDALEVAIRLAPAFSGLAIPLPSDPLALEFLPLLFDAGDGDGPLGGGAADDDGAGALPHPSERLPEELVRELRVLLDPDHPSDGAGTPLSLEELQRLLESGLLGELGQGSADDLAASGLFVTQLMGKLLGERRPPPEQGRDGVGPRRVARLAVPADDGSVFVYDEWDHGIADYRPAWCQLREVAVVDDAGVFFQEALVRHAELVPELRRCFQQVKPERYRTVRGLEDGETIDWNAAVEARVERRARGVASTKLYAARQRQEREVATLFLLDMSASTDEAARGSTDGERIIDIAKDALVIMAAALEEIGDAYAVYGFSGQGRERVEVYPVKRFDERLTPAVKGRLGGIEPKGSTRMGAALRHATALMRGLAAPAQHLVLLSDGFPQDLDYGEDRQSHTYGIRDTATALRETRAAGIRPFCITVDLAGHDYLREMCDPDTYVVIERVADLPRELPRLYQRLVRAA